MCIPVPLHMLAALQRHYLELLNIDDAGQQRKGKARIASAAVALGPQPPQQLPPGWPLPAGECEVWVLTSTSGVCAHVHLGGSGKYFVEI